MKTAEELNWIPVIVVGRIGYNGTETHAIRCETATQDEGTPWEKKLVRSAHTLCQSGRIGYRRPHSIRYDTPANRETVTCKNCRAYGCVK